MADHPLRERIEELNKRKEQALQPGAERRVEQQRNRGKMLARERIEYLVDPGSFHELDMLARHRSNAAGIADNAFCNRAVRTDCRNRDNRNNYGFNIGGPIYIPGFGEGTPLVRSLKDRAFFFLAYERNDGLSNKPNSIDPTLANIFRTRFNSVEQGVIKRTNVADVFLGKVDINLNNSNLLTLRFGDEVLTYTEPAVLVAPFFKEPTEEPRPRPGGTSRSAACCWPRARTSTRRSTRTTPRSTRRPVRATWSSPSCSCPRARTRAR